MLRPVSNKICIRSRCKYVYQVHSCLEYKMDDRHEMCIKTRFVPSEKIKNKIKNKTKLGLQLTLAKSSLTPQFSFALVSHKIPPTSVAKNSALARETTRLLSISVCAYSVRGAGEAREGWRRHVRVCTRCYFCVILFQPSETMQNNPPTRQRFTCATRGFDHLARHLSTSTSCLGVYDTSKAFSFQ